MRKTVTTSGADRTSVFKRYPLPWKRGWQHETKCDILDSNGERVFTIHTGMEPLGDPFIGDIADAILELMNGMPHTQDALGYQRRGPKVGKPGAELSE